MTFDELAASLKPHPSKAQILIEIDHSGKTLEYALDVLETAGLTSIERDVLLKGNSEWALIVLSSDDMRDAALRLSEAGFTKVKGINPTPIQAGEKGGVPTRIK
jgi:hypothetical protein